MDATVLYVKLNPDILVPIEWPLSGINSIVLKLATEIIMQNDHVDPILQVDGIPARMDRYFDEHGYYYVFHKISTKEIYDCYVYDIILRGGVKNNRLHESSGTSSCTGLCLRDDCSCSTNYVVTCYQVPPRLCKRKTLNTYPDDYVAHQSVKRCVAGHETTRCVKFPKIQIRSEDGTSAWRVTNFCTDDCFLSGVWRLDNFE